MPKIKTNRAAAKRFRKTASGKFKAGHAFKSHILTKKSTKRKWSACTESSEGVRHQGCSAHVAVLVRRGDKPWLV